MKTFYSFDENSKRLGAAMIAKGTELLQASGASRAWDFGISPALGWHLMGAARMGTDPAASVVDADNRAHDVPNLYIADSTSLATGGGVNPTSTIQAVALRCAEGIWEKAVPRREESGAMAGGRGDGWHVHRLLMGATVTNTGSSEGCGKSWPLCHGEFISSTPSRRWSSTPTGSLPALKACSSWDYP